MARTDWQTVSGNTNDNSKFTCGIEWKYRDDLFGTESYPADRIESNTDIIEYRPFVTKKASSTTSHYYVDWLTSYYRYTYNTVSGQDPPAVSSSTNNLNISTTFRFDQGSANTRYYLKKGNLGAGNVMNTSSNTLSRIIQVPHCDDGTSKVRLYFYFAGSSATSFTKAETNAIITLEDIPRYEEATQTFTTQSYNTTSGNNSTNSNLSFKSTTYTAGSTPNYAGDSFTYAWDKNNEANVGRMADPASLAYLVRADNNNYESSYTKLYSAWEKTSGSSDLYITYNRTATVDDCGKYIQARLYKYMKDNNGTEQHWSQSNGHYIQASPTISAVNCNMRSKRFYTGTPSCVVYRVSSYSHTTNGYGVMGLDSNSSGYTNNASVSYKFTLTPDANGEGVSGGIRWGKGTFNANYSLPTTLDIHTSKVTMPNITPTTDGWIYSSYYNPRTGSSSRLGTIHSSLGRLSIVNGSITLPTIDSIKPVSGNGTTVIVDSTKRVYSTQTNLTLTYRVTHSGNTNGFGYDARLNEDWHTDYKSSTFSGTSLAPVQANLWSSNYGVIDNASDTVNIQHDSLTTSGYSANIIIIPYIKDSSNYQIFGATNGAYVTSPAYTLYKISKPGIPTITKWSNTLPAIDGIKDNINYTVTSPSSWGNVQDFTKGYKMRYTIGNDQSHSDGYEWKFINTPTSTNTSFSGTITETYNRSAYTAAKMQIAATSYYSTVWNSYLDFQSDFSTEKSFNIVAKDPYSATTGTLTTPSTTTLSLNVPFTFKCPSETINGNSLIQTTTLIIDGSQEVTLSNPTYSMSTPNSATGALTVTFNNLTDSTPVLTRGVHTLQVKNEVTTYFDSTTPSNHVYFGTTTVYSNILTVEVAEIPLPPVMNNPSPSSAQKGGDREFTFGFSIEDWGCTDTAANNRHFEYEWVDVRTGATLLTGTLDATATSAISRFIAGEEGLWGEPYSSGGYTLRLRSTTVVGSSEWSEKQIVLYGSTPIADVKVSTSNILALPNWNWDLSVRWTQSHNGSYTPINTSYRGNTAPRSDGNVYTDYDFANGTNGLAIYNNLDNGNVTFNRISMPSAPNTSGYVIEIKTTGEAWPNLGGFTFRNQSSANTEYIVKIVAKIPLGYSITWNSNTIGSKVLDKYGPDARYITSNLGTGDWAEYYFRIRCGSVSPFSTTNFFSIVPNQGQTTVTWYLAYANSIILNSSGSITYNTPQTRVRANVLRTVDGVTTDIGRTILDWTPYNTRVNVNESLTSDLNGYEDGTYKMQVTYERNYTTKVYRTVKTFDIIPPEVNLYDESEITSCTESSDIIGFKIKLRSFAATVSTEAWYSLDYGETWTSIPQTSTSGANKYHELDINLSWLDVIYLKLHGVNPVDEKEEIFIHEMPSDYKVWLAWCRGEEPIVPDFVRRVTVSRNGAATRKLRHITKH